MVLLWPGFLVMLACIPLLAVAYWWAQRRHIRAAYRYASVSLIHAALPGQSLLRRYLPPALFLLALANLIIASARPVYFVNVETDLSTIILDIDVSGSMLLSDIPPSRLAAVETAAMSFIQHQKERSQIGVVNFSSAAQIVQPPTTDQDTLEAAIFGMTTGQKTAIGDGILEALEAIDQVHKQVEPPGKKGGINSVPLIADFRQSFTSEIIVLLTDGVNTTGAQPMDAARLAAERGVRIYTIGFGTHDGVSRLNNPSPDNKNLFIPITGGFSDNGIDEVELLQIAAITGGKYYSAESTRELEKVFASLPTRSIIRKDPFEISVAFVAIGAILSATSLQLSLLWQPLL